MFLAFFVLLLFIGHGQCNEECPSRCVCFHTTVRCMFLQLDHIPKVPADTTILDLRFNKIREIPPGIFQHLHNLNTLLLNNNHLGNIQDGAFNGLGNLKYLYLYKNKIKKIESESFQGLNSLEQLYVHFNLIEKIEPNTFSNLPSLERLFLHNNKLTRIPQGGLKHLRSLIRLRLDSNALICDCEIAWLVKMLRSSDTSMQATATCQLPTTLRGKSIASLSYKEFHCRKPRLTEQPLDVDVSFGTTVYFSCKADGNPQPEIIWLHNSDQIVPYLNDDGRLTILDDGTLMIATTEDSDQGIYECMAKNIAGEVKSRPAKMMYHREQVAPTFIETPISHSVIVGTNVIFPCSVSGSPSPVIRWSKDGIVLGNNPHHTIHDNGTLVINDVTERDIGSYECFASNAVGRIGASAQLIINGPPVLTNDPQDITVSEGQDVTLRCSVEGSPEPTILWKKEEATVFPGARITVSIDQTTLTIRRVREADQGTYQCIADNDFGIVSSSMRLSLKEKAPPFFSTLPHDVVAPLGSNVELHCKAGGDPNPEITWSKNGDKILTDDVKHRSNLRGNLYVYNVTSNDSGIYECAADNSLGFAATSIHLSVSNEEYTNNINDNNILPSVSRARRIVQQSVNNTLTNLIYRSNSPSRLLQLFRFPREGNQRTIAEAAEVYEHTLSLVKEDLEGLLNQQLSDKAYLKYLSPVQLERIANLSGCMAHREVENCEKNLCFHLKFRSFDGSCNNLKQSLWGASLVPFQRLLPPVYENGYNTPVGWSRDKLYNGHTKPSARLISTKLLSSDTVSNDFEFSHMLMQWGQFLDHDIDHTLEAISHQSFTGDVDCDSSCDRTHPCFPIEIPQNDPRIRRLHCMGFKRSGAICGSGRTSVFFNAVVPREQANSLTSFIDASNIYGSTEEHANHLRNFTAERGLLRHGITIPGHKPLLPFNDILPVDCRRDAEISDIGCFAAGDLRVNEQLGLISVHTIWMREHNRIATALHNFNPHWTGETIYQTTRKIIGAQMQHITYKHWLPKILGPAGMSSMGDYKKYNSDIDPTISNVFATAAFRFGHSLISPILQRLNASFQEIPQGHVPLYEAFFVPHKIIEDGGIDPLLRGLFSSPAKLRTSSQLVTSILTERLFEASHEVALDLSAMNIQRGRDHALPAYNKWRVFCNLTSAESFDDLRAEIRDKSIRDKLQEVYKHPGNIDLFVGGMLENSVKGSKVGPTFLCILADQFQRLRDGDRFWYENPSTFTAEQLNEIKKASLASVLCDNSDSITQVTNDLFVMPTKQSPHYVHCSKLPRIDLSMWMQCPHQTSNGCPVDGCMKPNQEEDLRVRRSLELQLNNNYKLDDLTEDRLESLENVIENLQKSVKKLKRRVRYLEKLKSPRRSRSRRLKCIDSEGKRKSRGQKWSPTPCKVCECIAMKQKSVVNCVDITCPAARCRSPRVVPGQCCPQC